ncbi:MAG: hypothetical protein ACRD6N_04015 [Pyrinomonadaceae bacterium]
MVPESGDACTADGDPTLERSHALVVDSCATGALIAKIGDSSADTKPDKDKLIVFGAGRHCVFTILEAKSGSLYFAINDTAKSQAKVKGQLEMTVFEALRVHIQTSYSIRTSS